MRLRQQDVIKYRIHQAVNDAFMGYGESANEPELVVDRPPMGTDWPFLAQPSNVSDIPVLRMREEPLPAPQEELPLQREVHPIGIYRDYLMVDVRDVFPEEGKEGVCFIDLPAAEATIWFDAAMASVRRSAASQRLLFPLTLSFPKADGALLAANIQEIVHLGIEMHQVGDGAFMIEAIPPFLIEKEVEGVLHALIAELQDLETAKTPAEKRLSVLAAKLSASVRKSQRAYHLDEARKIVMELLKLKNFRYCPLGRATTFILGENEIGSGFKSGSVEKRTR